MDHAALTPAELDALESRTTVTVRVDGRRRTLVVYWLDLLAVRDAGAGRLVAAGSGKAYDVTWDPEAGYRATSADGG